MTRNRLLLQNRLVISQEVSNQSKLNFGLVWFIYGPNMCASFQRNLRGCRFFFVDLIWNHPFMVTADIVLTGTALASGAVADELSFATGG